MSCARAWPSSSPWHSARREGAEQRALAAIVPLVEGKTALGGRPTAYVCERRVCALPTADPAVLARQLATAAPLDAAPSGEAATASGP